MGLLWTVALITAIAGWPVACGCIALEHPRDITVSH
jgi:hypothetical protein